MDSVEVYSRQEDLITPPNVAHVVGCGGVGTWAAIMLALAGTRTIHLYDDDVIAETNLNRLPYSPQDVGKDKVACLTALIKAMRPECEVIAHKRFNPALHQFSPSGLSTPIVIGAVDTTQDRQGIYDRCKKDGAYYIDVGAESHHCTVSDAPADWQMVTDRPGYFTPIWVAPAVIAAGLAVAAAVYGNIKEGETVAIDLRRHERLTKEAAHG